MAMASSMKVMIHSSVKPVNRWSEEQMILRSGEDSQPKSFYNV